MVVVSISVLAGCESTSALDRLVEARRLSADMLVHFTKAADAGNRAVMADTDEASVAFAREAEQATESVQHDEDALEPLLKGLGFSEEGTLLGTFGTQFAEYRTLDRTILELAVENTNLKAQQLSFGSAQQAADAFRDALETLEPSDPKDVWRTRALAATAVAGARDIQVLQAPHIAEANEAAMAGVEKRMAASEADVRSALKTLAEAIRPASRPQLATAQAAFDRLMDVNAEIIKLSRRNTNVRSLALALNEKGKITTTCESTLRALQDALAKRGFTGTR
jgi:hypothetical protein